ncbi:MAG: hypothetical protein VW443_00400 [Pseudomonadales bacterium]
MIRFNAKRLVEDLGGVRTAAAILGKSRTAPYRWISTGYMSTYQLEQIKQVRPEIKFDQYFEEENEREAVSDRVA